MRFIVDVPTFSSNLKLISSVVASSSTTATTALVAKNGELWAYANTDTGTLKCKCQGVSGLEGKGIAGVDFNLLDKMLKGRGKIEFDNVGSFFNFKAVEDPDKKGKAKLQKYDGELAIIPVIKESIAGYDDILEKGKKTKKALLDLNTFNTLRASLSATNIAMIHSSDVLNTYIRLKEGNLEVVGSDNFHLAYAKVKCKTESEFQISPTKTTFDVLGKLSDFYHGSAEVEFSTDAIKARTENYTISCPSIQSSDTAFLRVLKYIEEMPDSICTCTLDVPATISALDNILSIYEDGALIAMEFKKSKTESLLALSMKTTMGIISDNLVVSDVEGKSFKCTFDPRMLLDSLNLAKNPTAFLSYIEDKALVIKLKKEKTSLTYVNSVVKE
jgi:hypothetical protein